MSKPTPKISFKDLSTPHTSSAVIIYIIYPPQCGGYFVLLVDGSGLFEELFLVADGIADGKMEDALNC